MSRTDPCVTRYMTWWPGYGYEVTQCGVGMLFAAMRRGWPWVHRVGGDVRRIHDGAPLRRASNDAGTEEG